MTQLVSFPPFSRNLFISDFSSPIDDLTAYRRLSLTTLIALVSHVPVSRSKLPRGGLFGYWRCPLSQLVIMTQIYLRTLWNRVQYEHDEPAEP